MSTATATKPRGRKKKQRTEAATTANDPRLDRYKTQFVPIDSIKPSPENDDLYGEIKHDSAMEILIGSIQKNGLEQPLLITQDDYVLSGHRRLYASKHLKEELAEQMDI